MGRERASLEKNVNGIASLEEGLGEASELLQLAVMDDLLGPAGGPHERIVDMGVRARYLVGKLAPREAAQGGIEGLEGPLANDEVEEPTDPKAPGQHEPAGRDPRWAALDALREPGGSAN